MKPSLSIQSLAGEREQNLTADDFLIHTRLGIPTQPFAICSPFRDTHSGQAAPGPLANPLPADSP